MLYYIRPWSALLAGSRAGYVHARPAARDAHLMPHGGFHVKQCSKCLKVKPLSDFPREKLGKDGLRAWCKACIARKMAAWRAKNPDKERANKQASYQRHRMTRIAAVRRWRDANPELAATYDHASY